MAAANTLVAEFKLPAADNVRLLCVCERVSAGVCVCVRERERKEGRKEGRKSVGLKADM